MAFSTGNDMQVLPMEKIRGLVKQNGTMFAANTRADHHVPAVLVTPRRGIAKPAHVHARRWRSDDRLWSLGPVGQVLARTESQALRFLEDMNAVAKRGFVLRSHHHAGVDNSHAGTVNHGRAGETAGCVRTTRGGSKTYRQVTPMNHIRADGVC